MASNQECRGLVLKTNSNQTQSKFAQLQPTQHSPESQHYAPFMIKSKRFKQNRQKGQIPAIGTYNLPSCFERKRSPFEGKMDQLIEIVQRKKQEMSMFKSDCQRFENSITATPGLASYNLFKNEVGKPNKVVQVRQKKVNQPTKICPSIPSKDNKYGYAVARGKLQRIEKGPQQSELEKQSRRHYVGSLKGELCFKKQIYASNSHTDLKNLYETAQKTVKRASVSLNSPEKSNISTKKHKFQRLYHSKAVLASDNSRLLGPGQYDTSSKDFQTHSRNDKFQFFGSSEVSFKQKVQAQTKGYRPIELIKSRKILQKAEKKWPFRPFVNRPEQRNCQYKIAYPGPGQYNPDNQHKLIGRGNTLFPESLRFKQMYPDKSQIEEAVKTGAINEEETKVERMGSLKKNHFKPMHKVYEPSLPSQISQIVTENRKTTSNIEKPQARQSRYQSAEIESWSREQARSKLGKKSTIKDLKQQLQIINQAPQAEDQMRNNIKMMKEISEKTVV